MERDYHAGQPSVLDDSDSHLPAEEELKGVGQDEFQKVTLKLHGFMYKAVSLFSINKILQTW